MLFPENSLFEIIYMKITYFSTEKRRHDSNGAEYFDEQVEGVGMR
jgi:hypothetical protein